MSLISMPRVGKFGVKVQECSLASVYDDPLTLLSLCCVPNIICMESCSYDVHVSNAVPPDSRGGENDSLVKVILHFSHLEKAYYC